MAPRFSVAAFALAATTTLFPLSAVAGCSTADSGARCIRVLGDVVLPSEIPTRPAALLDTSFRSFIAEESGAMSSASTTTPAVDVGQVVPRGEYNLILNADYYGLPPVSDGWVYMRVGSDAFRVDWQTHQVLERVTHLTAANF